MEKFNRIISVIITTVLVFAYPIQNVCANDSGKSNNNEIEMMYIDAKGTNSIKIHEKKFENKYKEISDTCVGVNIAYKEFLKLDMNMVKEMLDDGVTFVVSVENHANVEYIKNTYARSDEYQMYCEEEVMNVCLYNYNGETIISYICIDEIEEQSNERNVVNEVFLKEKFPEIIKKISDNSHYTYLERINEMGLDESYGDIEFQVCALPGKIEPHMGIRYVKYNNTHIATQSITIYVYEGCKYGNSAYDYVISAVEVSPTDYFNVRNFETKIERRNSHTSLISASHINDNVEKVSYELKATTGLSSNGISGTINGSIKNSYSCTAISVTEQFSNREKGYVEWFAECKNRILGQSRRIEPGVVVMLDDKTKYIANIRASIGETYIERCLSEKNVVYYVLDMDGFSVGVSYGYK